MKMEVLRCHTVEGVIKELLMFGIRPMNDGLAVRGSLEVSFWETSAWLGTTAI
jgi:hypothetical protein